MAHLVYCDYIAHSIKRTLKGCVAEGIVQDVGRTELDLHPESGRLLSHKKTIAVTDFEGRKYRVTVEDIS